MATQNCHRGIGYDVRKVGPDLWEWAIFPPDSVKGFALKKGRVVGAKEHAVQAAKREIESQGLLCSELERPAPLRKNGKTKGPARAY